MYLFIEKRLRGRISYIAKRYAKANDKCMENCDPTKLSKIITYLDINNLYGWIMNRNLPYERFKWLKNADNFDVNSVMKRVDIGCILKVDLEHPDELHVLHNDYPLAPKKPAIPQLLDYCKETADEYEIKVGDVKKLIPNLGKKTNYVFCYKNLQLYLSLGMQLTKTHRVLKFKQSDRMKNISILALKKNKCCQQF